MGLILSMFLVKVILNIEEKDVIQNINVDGEMHDRMSGYGRIRRNMEKLQRNERAK